MKRQERKCGEHTCVFYEETVVLGFTHVQDHNCGKCNVLCALRVGNEKWLSNLGDYVVIDNYDN